MRNCALVFALALFAAPLIAQSGLPPREIVADVSHVAGPHSSTPLMTVGAGRANEGLRADWQQQLAVVQKEIGFRYLRFHGLLHDDMGVYDEDASGKPTYNFQYVDALYDALLALHIRPFVELSFMPAKLASGTKTVFWWKANVTPPKDMDKWNGLIRALLQHWRERYGEDEIAQWYYEVWNEPDLDGFWSGTQQQYLDLYRNTAEDVKSVCRRCRVGGPASAMDGLQPIWLKFIADNHVPADFLSTHTYGVIKGAFDADGKAGTVLDVSPDSIVKRVRGSRSVIDSSATPKLELHYTEWSTSYTPSDPIHDQYISAPFILQKLRETSPLAQSMSYWTFTDIFEESGPRFTPFHGGFGLINYQGIRKPSFFAYKWLAQLGSEDIESNDRQSWITKSGDGSVQALFWNYTAIAPPGDETNQVFYKQEQPSNPAPSADLKIEGLKSGRYRVNVYRTGYRQNDAYTAYLHMGSPRQLTRAQVAELQSAASGAPVETRDVDLKNGVFTERFEMHQNDTVLVILKRE
ncbi:xylan 1,4-beta-xylosidase [Silvibacterium bohemicum]|uniref:Xylan 1,4-beta-xylosidase n=1 Tax=Silvibacterium bohemicum TaxID=1577686 RepID=A0A841JNS2_9BACT|nr:glycoside hydrolase [Silvibacterium bohemicum]MBB6142085.1 xylan 1,4-beta-xylosidase [Silvibacterium bohemicum]